MPQRFADRQRVRDGGLQRAALPAAGTVGPERQLHGGLRGHSRRDRELGCVPDEPPDEPGGVARRSRGAGGAQTQTPQKTPP